MQRQLKTLTKEKSSLKEICLENVRYKRRWDLRLLGLPEKGNEDTMIGILTRVLLVSVQSRKWWALFIT